jgi:hypothetical protein
MSANEASVVENINVYPVDNLKSLVRPLKGEKLIEPLKPVDVTEILSDITPEFYFSEFLGQNDKLYTEILEKDGLLIFEYDPDFKATIWSFLQRNRIVSALLTVGVLIIEA